MPPPPPRRHPPPPADAALGLATLPADLRAAVLAAGALGACDLARVEFACRRAGRADAALGGLAPAEAAARRRLLRLTGHADAADTAGRLLPKET